MRRCRSILALIMLAMVVTACAAEMVVMPPPSPAIVEFRLPATILYDGNREYLPRVLVAMAGSVPITVRYAYDVVHGSERTHILGVMFNPAAMAGFPVIGKDTFAVIGRLEVLKDGNLVKAYDATAALTNRPSLFYEGETYTEMRRRGLLAVRDSIETQVVRDREALLRLVGP
jgi:hypothetical protein